MVLSVALAILSGLKFPGFWWYPCFDSYAGVIVQKKLSPERFKAQSSG